ELWKISRSSSGAVTDAVRLQPLEMSGTLVRNATGSLSFRVRLGTDEMPTIESAFDYAEYQLRRDGLPLAGVTHFVPVGVDDEMVEDIDLVRIDCVSIDAM